MCHELARERKLYRVRNCERDEGRPLGGGLQEQPPNPLKLRWLRARVVNVKEKAWSTGQVSIRKASASEPAEDVSKSMQTMSKPGDVSLSREESGRGLLTARTASGI